MTGIIATELDVDLHPHHQRSGRDRFDNYFCDVNIREIALSSRAEAARGDDRRNCVDRRFNRLLVFRNLFPDRKNFGFKIFPCADGLRIAFEIFVGDFD
jgi:hypothetical protein